MNQGGTELAGDVAVLDGELYPLAEFSYNIENNIEHVKGLGTLNTNPVVTSTEISGTLHTYKPIGDELVPMISTMYLFTAKEGTHKRWMFTDTIFAQPSLVNREVLEIDFVSDSIEVS